MNGKKLYLSIIVLSLLLAGSVGWVSATPLTYNTWYPTSTGISTPVDVRAFTFSSNYSNDHVIYAGTYAGVYRSSDSGFNWSLIGTTGEVAASSITSMAISPDYNHDKTIYAGTSNGVLMLADADTAVGGSNWVNITGDISDGDVQVIAFSPNYASDHTLFAGTRDSGLFKTTNINGPATSWSVAGNLLNTTNARITSIVFTPDYATSRTLFVGASSSANGGGVFKSTDGGSSWMAMSSGLADALHRNVEALVISPDYLNDHTIFAGLYAAQGVYRSTNSGSTWGFLTGTENLYIQAMAISPAYASDGTVFAGEDGGGVYRSTSRGASWVEMNTGFNEGKSVLVLAIPPDRSKQPFNLFAGTFSDQVWQMIYGNTSVYLPFVTR